MDTSFKNYFEDMYYDSISKLHNLYCTAYAEQVIFDPDNTDVIVLKRELNDLQVLVAKLKHEIDQQIREVTA